MVQSKRFQSNENGEVVTILADNGVFYNLSNGANIKKDIFFQKYSEMLDASNFFQQQSAAGLQNLTEQLRNMDSSKVHDIGGNIPPSVKVRQEAVSEQVAAPPEYRDMLLKRFQYEQQNKDLSQYRVYENEDDAAADWDRKIQATQQQQQRPRPQPPVQEQYQEPQQFHQPPPEPVTVQQNSAVPSYVSPEEEAFRVFRSFKKIYPITLSVDFEERIAQPEFIKLMAVNYEGDIIKFYTKEFMNRIYNDPGFLENKIYDKLKRLIFEEDEKPMVERKAKPKATKKPAPKKRNIPNVPKDNREKLQEGVE